jgi:hypothetical protein
MSYQELQFWRSNGIVPARGQVATIFDHGDVLSNKNSGRRYDPAEGAVDLVNACLSTSIESTYVLTKCGEHNARDVAQRFDRWQGTALRSDHVFAVPIGGANQAQEPFLRSQQAGCGSEDQEHDHGPSKL